MAYSNVLQDIRACIELRPPSRMPVFALGLEFDMVSQMISGTPSAKRV